MREHKTEKCIGSFGGRAVELVTKGDRRLTEVTNSTASILFVTYDMLPISNLYMNWEDD